MTCCDERKRAISLGYDSPKGRINGYLARGRGGLPDGSGGRLQRAGVHWPARLAPARSSCAKS